MNAKKPHFLEVFLSNFSSERLEVPSKFVKHFGGRTSGSLSLTGPSGNSWHVDLVEHKGHVFFHVGWPTFVKDHAIQCGDSLVFRYDGNLHFTVQIFDQSSCEKDEAFYAKCSQQSLNCGGYLGKRRSRDREAFLCDVFGEKKHQKTSNLVHLDLPGGYREKELEFCMNEDENASSSPEVYNASSKPIVVGLSAGATSQIKKKASTVFKKEAGVPISTSISKFIESRAAQYFNSSFPFFVRVMNCSNVSGNGTMKIPIKFSAVHFPNCRIKVTLKNLNGDSWTINSVPTARKSSTMHTFCGGWLAFIRGNGIKIEDVCIFEFVGEFEMLVRILRLGMEGLDTQTENSSIDLCGFDASGCPLGTVAEDTSGGYFPNGSEKLNELCIYEHQEHKANAEKISPELQEEVVLIAMSGDATAPRTSNHVAQFPMSGICGEGRDKLPQCNAEGTMLSEIIRINKSDFRDSRMVHNQLNDKEALTAVSFTNPFPSFMKVMMSSNVGGSFTLAVPRKFSAEHLPSHKTKIVLQNMNGDSWNVVSTRYGHQTKLCGGWMSFVRKNDVKVGDVCIFELVAEKVLQVRIFEAEQKGLESPNNDDVADDPIASGESSLSIVLPQA